jgi:hypothetical protein
MGSKTEHRAFFADYCYEAQVGLNLTYHLYIMSAGITGMYYHTWLS